MSVKLIPTALSPMEQDGYIDQKDVAAIILRNAGTATVNLFLGAYTLDSKETLSINVTEMEGLIDLSSIPVVFDTSSGLAKKLQILILRINPNAC